MCLSGTAVAGISIDSLDLNFTSVAGTVGCEYPGVRYMHRAQRDHRRQCHLPSDSVLMLDAPARSITGPSVHAERNERDAWLALALELLDPDDREVIRLRDWDGLTFVAAGERLGLSEEGTRKRYRRALPRLAKKLEQLRLGNWRDTLPDSPAASGGESSQG